MVSLYDGIGRLPAEQNHEKINPPASADMAIAIGARLKRCHNIITLGFKPNFYDYDRKEADLIRNARKIYYPTAFYAPLFHVMGKPIFPSLNTYAFVQDKISQTALFNLRKIPHPKTRVFYGKARHQAIVSEFSYPFIAKIPRGSSMGRGVFLIRTDEELAAYLRQNPNPAYIQAYHPHDGDIRVVIIGQKIRLAYWRKADPVEFRSNLSCGGTVDFEKVPQKALDLALYTAIQCGWDDVGLDLLPCDDGFMVIEANMKYGRKGFRAAGIDYHGLLESLIMTGEI